MAICRALTYSLILLVSGACVAHAQPAANTQAGPDAETDAETPPLHQVSAYLAVGAVGWGSTSGSFLSNGREEARVGVGARFERVVLNWLSLGALVEFVFLPTPPVAPGGSARRIVLDSAVWFKGRHVARVPWPGVILYGGIPVGFSWDFDRRGRGINTGFLAGLEIVLGKAAPFLEIGWRMRWLNGDPVRSLTIEQTLSTMLQINAGIAVQF